MLFQSTVLSVTLIMLQCCVCLSVVCDVCTVAKWCVLHDSL